MGPIKPTQDLHKFLISKQLVTNTDYASWSEKYSGDAGLTKIHSIMDQRKLNPGDIETFRKTAFEAYEPVKKKEPSGPVSEAGSPPSVAPIAASPSEPSTEGPLATNAKPFDLPGKIFNTKSKFAFDDVLMAAAAKGDQPIVGDIAKGAVGSFKIPTPLTRPLTITGTENFFADDVKTDIEEDGFRQVKKMATMDENQVAAYKLKSAENYGKKAERVQNQSLANLGVKYDGFPERFAKDMKTLTDLDREEAKAEKSGDEPMLGVIRKERETILTHYEQYGQDPDFQLLTSAQKALGNAQEFVNTTIEEIDRNNAPKEAIRKKMQLVSDMAQDTSTGIGGALNPMGRWAARKLLTKGAEAANLLAMASPSDQVGMNPFDIVSDGLNDVAQTYFSTPSQLDKPVFELDPQSFRESFKGVETAEMDRNGQRVEVVYANGKPVQIRSKESGRLIEMLSPEDSAAIGKMELPTKRVTSKSQALLNTISIAADMGADIYGGNLAFKAMALGKSGGLYGIWSSMHNSLFKEYRDAGLPDDEARLASFISSGAIANIDWAFGGIERFIGGANPLISGAIKKAQAEVVATGGLNAISATKATLKAYAKTVIKEPLSETVLEPLAQKGVEMAFAAGTQDELYQREYEFSEMRDNLLYSFPIAIMTGFGAAKAETQAYLGTAYLKAIQEADRTSKYIGGLVKDGLINADQAKAVEENLAAARTQMGMLKENLTPEQEEEAARLVFLDAHWEKIGKEAPPAGKSHAKAQQEAVQKELQQYLPVVPGQEIAQPTEQNNSEVAQPETQVAQPEVQSTTQTVVDQEPAAATESVMTPEQAVEEIKAKKLNRAEGLNMGANQALGTYVSTEETNRYSDKAEPVEVDVKNPYVSTDDPGLTGMREQVVKDNIDQFEPSDFVNEDGTTATVVPENPNIDDLSTKGNNKAAALVTKTLQDQGYDSIYFPESNTQEGELVVFNRDAVRKTSEKAEDNKQQEAEQVLKDAQAKAKKAEADLNKKREQLAIIEKENAPRQMEIGSPGVEQNLFADDVSAKREEVKAAEKAAKDARENVVKAEAQLEVAQTPANQTEIPSTPSAKPPQTKEQRALEVRRARRANISKQYKKVVDAVNNLGLGIRDAATAAMTELMYGRALTYKSIKGETGLGTPEMKKLFWATKSEKEGGVTVENLAEQLWEEQGEQSGLSVQDYRDAIIDVLKSHEGRASIETALWEQVAKAGEQVSQDRAEGLGIDTDRMAYEVSEEYDVDPEVAQDAAEADGISEDAVSSILDENGEIDKEALAGITENDLSGSALEAFRNHQLAAEHGLPVSEVKWIREQANDGVPPPEWMYDNKPEVYETVLDVYNRLRSEKEINDSLGGTTASNLNRPGPVLETRTPTPEQIAETPAVKSWTAQKKAEIKKKINEVKSEIKKDMDDAQNLGISPEEMYRRNNRLAKNTLHLAYLYVQEGVVDFADFLAKSKLAYSSALEKIFENARILHKAVHSPLFFHDGRSEAVHDVMVDTRINWQDQNFAILDFIRQAKEQGIKIPDEIDAYAKKELQAGRAKAMRDEMELWFTGKKPGEMGHKQTSKASFLGRLKDAGFNPVDFNMFMIASHAKERNARGVEVSSKRVADKIADYQAKIALENAKPNPNRGVVTRYINRIQEIQNGQDADHTVITDAAHLTDQEADQLMSQFTDEQKAKLNDFGKEFREKVIHGRVNMLHEAGIVGTDAKDALIGGTKKGSNVVWENYVPIMVKGGALEPGEFTAGGVTMSFSRAGKGGSKSGIHGLTVTDKYSWVKGEITNVVETAMAQYMSATTIAEDNKTRQAMYELVESLQDRMGGNAASFKGRGIVKLNEQGDLIDYDDSVPDGVKDNSIASYFDGKVHYTYFAPNRDENGREEPHPLVTTFKRAEPGKISRIGKALILISRTGMNAMRNLITTWNIGFGPVNFLSDLQDSLQNIGDVKAEYGLDRLNHVRSKMVKNLIPAAAVLGGKKRFKFVDKLPDNVEDMSMANFWQEAVEAGMPISFSQYEGIDESIKNYEKEIAEFYDGESMGKTAGRVTANVLSYVNDIFENQTRLAAYAAFRQSGMSAQQAAQAAKNISLNFEKKGVQMKKWSPFYLFLNAGVQGTFRSAKNVKNFKRTYPMYAARAAWIAGMRYSTIYLSTMMAGDDDDKQVQTQVDKLLADSWKTSNYNIYPNPFDPKNPITVRKPYSALRLWDAVVESAVDIAADRITAGDAQIRMMTAMATTMDPISGGSTNIEGYLPTLLKIPVEAFITRRDYTGRELISHEQKNMPLYTQYNYKKEGIANKMAIRLSEAMAYDVFGGVPRTGDKKKETIKPTFDASPASIEYAFSQLIPGLPTELINTGAEIYDAIKEGRDIDPGKVILSRRFVRKMENNPNSDASLVYGFINRDKKLAFGLTDETSTAHQKKLVMDALARIKADKNKNTDYSKIRSRLKEKYPEWFK